MILKYAEVKIPGISNMEIFWGIWQNHKQIFQRVGEANWIFPLIVCPYYGILPVGVMSGILRGVRCRPQLSIA